MCNAVIAWSENYDKNYPHILDYIEHQYDSLVKEDLQSILQKSHINEWAINYCMYKSLPLEH